MAIFAIRLGRLVAEPAANKSEIAVGILHFGTRDMAGGFECALKMFLKNGLSLLSHYRTRLEESGSDPISRMPL